MPELPRVRVGCDVQSVSAVSDALAEHERRYLDRVYTEREQVLCAGRVESLAGRFAAKEAVLKLLGDPQELDLRLVEIDADQARRPRVRLHAAAAERAAALGVVGIDVSISHDGAFAFAVAVGVESPGRHVSG